MKLALKHQVLMAPAIVLILMSILLAFLQYTYWDLSVKRNQAKQLGNAFVAMSSANFALDRLHALSEHLIQQTNIDLNTIKELAELYQGLESSVETATEALPLSAEDIETMAKALKSVNPQTGLTKENIPTVFIAAKNELNHLQELLDVQRVSLTNVRDRNIDDLVAKTTFVSILVLGFAILAGIMLSFYFSRSILKRISLISNGAAAILRGEYNPFPPPAKRRDELDDLAISINSMTDRLLRVVGAEKLLEGAEEERRRIAMELHDQTLADLSTVLRRMRDIPKHREVHELTDIESRVVDIISGLREVMDNLHPQTLDILGLPAAIESYIETKLSDKNIPVGLFFAHGDIDSLSLSRLAALTLYRISIEAINNVVKHAQAERYEVTLSLGNNELAISIEDNGKGLPEGIFEITSGRGLHNMRERVKTIGGSIEWRPSRFSTGTLVDVRFPYQQNIA